MHDTRKSKGEEDNKQRVQITKYDLTNSNDRIHSELVARYGYDTRPENDVGLIK